MDFKFNIDYFEKILNSIHSAKVSHVNLNIKSAVQDGEQYSNEILRAKLTYLLKNVTYQKVFILKKSLGDKVKRSFNVFAKEIYVYDNIIPQVEKYFNQNGIKLKLAPTCFDNSVSDSFLLLEDLSINGFANIDRKIGLNRNYLEKSIEVLAKWHIGTTKNMVNADFLILYSVPHIRPDGSKHYRSLFENAMAECILTFENDIEMNSITEKMTKLKDNIFDKCCTAVARDENEFNVLNHGDIWSNNIMFSDNVNVFFIDFQMCYYGSPILDLCYLLFTSSSEEVTAQDWDELIEYYFNEMTKLSGLEQDGRIFSREEFDNQFSNRAIFGAAFCLFTIPMKSIEQTAQGDVLNFLNSTESSHEFRKELYSRISVKSLLRKLLLYFDRKKIF